MRASLANNTSAYNEDSITITTVLSELESIIEGQLCAFWILIVRLFYVLFYESSLLALIKNNSEGKEDFRLYPVNFTKTFLRLIIIIMRRRRRRTIFLFMFRLLMSWKDVHVSLNFYFAIAFVFT